MCYSHTDLVSTRFFFNVVEMAVQCITTADTTSHRITVCPESTHKRDSANRSDQQTVAVGTVLRHSSDESSAIQIVWSGYRQTQYPCIQKIASGRGQREVARISHEAVLPPTCFTGSPAVCFNASISHVRRPLTRAFSHVNRHHVGPFCAQPLAVLSKTAVVHTNYCTLAHPFAACFDLAMKTRLVEHWL